jgi:hypothetical protein
MAIQRLPGPPHTVTPTAGNPALYSVERSAVPSRVWRAAFLRPPSRLTDMRATPALARLELHGARFSGCVWVACGARLCRDLHRSAFQVSNTYDAVGQLITQRSLVQIQPPQPSQIRGLRLRAVTPWSSLVADRLRIVARFSRRPPEHRRRVLRLAVWQETVGAAEAQEWAVVVPSTGIVQNAPRSSPSGRIID